MRLQPWTLLVMLAFCIPCMVQCAPLGVPAPPDRPQGTTPSPEQPTPLVEPGDQCASIDPARCEAHADCICVDDSGCFLGNRTYYTRCIQDKERGCPDMCSEAPPTACIDNQCTNNYPRREWDWSFADCEDRVPATETARCQAIVAWSVAKHDPQLAIDTCPNLTDFSHVCYQSVAESIAAENIGQAEALCDRIKSDYCFSRIANIVSGLSQDMLERAISLCGKIDMQATQAECYQNVASDVVRFRSVQDGLALCSADVQDPIQRDYCFTRVASAAADPSICQEVDGETQKRNCISHIYEGKVRSILDSEPEEQALDYCRTRQDPLEKDVCFVEVARTSTNLAICDEVVDSGLRDSCSRYMEQNRGSE